MEYINREFKAVVQDMTHVYLGAQMSVKELISYEDVPFKVKSIFNKFFSSEDMIDQKISDLLGNVKKDEFVYQAMKQLKLKFKVGTYVNKKNSQIYKSDTYNVDDFIELFSSQDNIFVEEVVFNKLALMAFST